MFNHMKITVSEALKLKNQISQAVNATNTTLNYGTLGRNVEYGVLEEDGNVVGTPNAAWNFAKLLRKLEVLMDFNNQVQTAIGEFNAEKGIPALVRERHNLSSVVTFLEAAEQQCNAYTQTRTEMVSGVGKVDVARKYTPYVDFETEAKPKIREHRTRIREIDNEIALLNASLIELPFSYDELDEVLAG